VSGEQRPIHAIGYAHLVATEEGGPMRGPAPSRSGSPRRNGVRTTAAIAAIVLICGATTAGAAKLITGSDVKDGSLTGKDVKNGSLTGKDVKNGSLTGKDVKDGSVARGDLKAGVQDAIPNRITGALPTNGFSATDDTVVNTSDGVAFGPYPDGGSDGGSICTNALDGQTLNDVQHLAFEARYTSTGNTGGVGVPYLRVFLEDDAQDPHDAIFSPNTQPPDPDIEEGPFHTWVATAGLWRYDDDSGSGGQYGLNGAPFSEVQGDHGTEVITGGADHPGGICISVGNSAGADLSALMLTWEVNSKEYAFGL
jgi:hypothetical protein